MSAVDKGVAGIGRERTSDGRDAGSAGKATRPAGKRTDHEPPPAAGAHAAHHLVNEDSTPGAGALPSHAHNSGRDVDGGAG